MAGVVYIAMSLDGFIARPDGRLDWLEAPDTDNRAQDDFEQFLAGVDAIVMGRNTYDTVLSFGVWAYGDKPVFVLTHRPLSQPEDPQASVEAITGEPADIIATLAARSLRTLYVDGGLTIQAFLSAGLIERMIITRVPVLLGDGIPLFAGLNVERHFECVSAGVTESGFEQVEYRQIS